MANILNNPSYRNQEGYNGFPLRNSVQFSSALGQLLPVWWHPLDPGDKVKIRTGLLTRTQPVESAAMIDIHEHLDWFFVPMQNLFKFFEDFFYGINDSHTAFAPSLSNGPYPYMTNRTLYNMIVTRYFGGATSNDYTPVYDDAGYDELAGIYRVMQCLGYDIDSLFAAGSTGLQSQHVFYARSFWSGLAYQAIYYSHYRLSNFESNAPQHYNVDDLYDDPSVSGSGSVVSRRVANFFKLHYRPIRKDFFHAYSPSPLFGAESLNSTETWANGIQSTQLQDWLAHYGLHQGAAPVTGGSDVFSPVQGSNVEDPSNPSSVFPYSVNSDVASSQVLSTASIRGAFAFEKLLEITRRAGKHIDAQTLAHFGVKMPDGISGEPVFIGSQDSSFSISDVISTADTEQSPLGEIAGKGYNKSGSDQIYYEAKCHGIIMCIHSSDVDLHYKPSNVDKLNTLVTPYDFYHPEFDDLGMQPIFAFQGFIDYGFESNSVGAGQNRSFNNQIVGWNYRYFAQKVKYNRSIGSFAGGMSHWTVSRDGFLTQVNSQSGRVELLNNVANLIVRPNLLDDIMLANYSSTMNIQHTQYDGDGDWYISRASDSFYEDIFGYDPFLHDLYVDCEYVSKKSTYGLPSL